MNIIVSGPIMQSLPSLFAQIYDKDVVVLQILEELGISDLLNVSRVSKRFNHLILTSSSLQLRLQAHLHSINLTSASLAPHLTSKQAVDRLVAREQAFHSLTPRITTHDSLHPPEVANWRDGLLYKAWYKYSVPPYLGNSYMKFWRRRGAGGGTGWDSWTAELDAEVDGLTIWPSEGLLVVAKYLERDPVSGRVPTRLYFLDCDVNAYPPNTTFTLELANSKHPRATLAWADLILPEDTEPSDYTCFVPCTMNRLAVGVSNRLLVLWDWMRGYPVAKIPGDTTLDSTWTSFLSPFHLAFLADTCSHIIEGNGPHLPIAIMEVFRLPSFCYISTPDGTSFIYDDIPSMDDDVVLLLPDVPHAPATSAQWVPENFPEEARERRLVISDGIIVFSAEIGHVVSRHSAQLPEGQATLMMLSGAVSVDHLVRVVNAHLKIPADIRKALRYEQWSRGQVSLWTHTAPNTWDRNIAAYGSRFVSLSFVEAKRDPSSNEVCVRMTIRDFHRLTIKYGERRLGHRLGGDLDAARSIQGAETALGTMSLSEQWNIHPLARNHKPRFRLAETDITLQQALPSRDNLLIVVFDGDTMIVWADGLKVTTLDFNPA